MTLIYIALMIGGLIFVHELGHFLVARWMGVHVVEFSIGFGPKLFSFKGKQRRPDLPPTEYVIAALPIGGFVRMLGADPTDDVEPAIRDVALNTRPVWKRFLISAAGPAFNLILPFFIFFFLGLGASELQPSVVGTVNRQGPAWETGLRPGDRVVEIDGEPVSYFYQIPLLVEDRPDQDIPIAWDHLGETRRGTVRPVARDVEIMAGISETLGKIGVAAAYSVPVIGVDPGSVAATSGVRPWDRVVTVDGVRVRYLHQTLELIAKAKDRPVELGLLSYEGAPGQNLAFEVATPRKVTLPPSPDAPSRGVFSGECLIHHIVPSSPAAQKGLRRGDRILSVAGQPCDSWLFVLNIIQAHTGKDVSFVIQRDGKTFDIALSTMGVPWPHELRPKRKRALHGIEVVWGAAEPDTVPNDDTLGFALWSMHHETGEAISGTMTVIGGLLTGRVSVNDGLGGPVMIGQLTAKAAERGAGYFFWLMAMLSVSLGLINLLPVPILDGGTMMFLAIEAIRRKPVSMRVRMIATYAGLAFIVILMVIVVRNDLTRCLAGVIGL